MDKRKYQEKIKYKNFTLDPFQVKAIQSIEEGHSVVVSAGTGTGKTLIADYLIDKFIKERKRVIYTAPIKALSNQKFRDFTKEYGNKIGLLTGDVTINHDAQILIMTTEIYRNMLINKEYFEDLAYVIFDEVHYINDFERGSIWEEAIIFSPSNVRFLCLSATIPNADELAGWIKKIQKHDVDVINYNKRAVPLKNHLFTKKSGIKEMPFPYPIEKRKDKNHHKKRRGLDKKEFLGNIVALVNEIMKRSWTPSIVFAFSRKQTWDLANAVSTKGSFLTQNQQFEVMKFFDSNVSDEIVKLDSVQNLRSLLIRGIGVHNAGLLPDLKEIVEVLFSKGLVKFLFATETFALGINMPARSVSFVALRKWDGYKFRPLLAREYFQMAGRAGRRGMDTEGDVVTIVDSYETYAVLNEILKVKSEPIVSQFKLSYNTVLNLINSLDDSQIKKFLKSNFAYYQSKGSNVTYGGIVRQYRNMIKTLIKYNFIRDGKLTEKGVFATEIYSEEIAVTELVFTHLVDALTPEEFLVVLAALVYEPKFSDRFNMKNVNAQVSKIWKSFEENDFLARRIKVLNLRRMYKIVTYWCDNHNFEELLDLTNLSEGDLIRLFREIVDMLHQLVKSSSKNMPQLVSKFENLIGMIDKGVVNVF